MLVLTGLGQPMVMAAGKCGPDEIETAIIGGGCVKKDNSGNGIYEILSMVLNIMTYGVGILATLGLVYSGILYLTAGGKEDQVIKAKTRIFQIVVGLLIYAVMWLILEWLLPGGLRL